MNPDPTMLAKLESIYSKLYEKYNNLKTKKDSEIESYNHDQEVKFTNYISAVEELVNCQRSENDRLRTQNHDLKNELASVRAYRSDKEELCAHYQKLLAEETKKVKELSEEVQRLRNLQQEGPSCSARGRYIENGQMESPGGTYLESRHISSVNTRKGHSTDDDTDSHNRVKLPVVTEIERDSHRGLRSDNDQSNQKESCCGKVISSGDSIIANSMFHALLEFLIGMKFEVVAEAGGPCLSALHQSSGYSFTLMWLTKSSENESLELMYHVLSLGTFERIAPEWMRKDLIFSSSMCPVFFKRVSLIIGLDV